MKVGKDYFGPESSFNSIEKDYAILVKKLLTNQRLLKLLYYTQPDCLKGPDLTTAQAFSLINKQIRIVPKLDISEECPCYVLITTDNFFPNANNPEFRDCSIVIDILCHPDHWNLGNFQLRPYKILGEIDSMINNQKFTGIGTLQFAGANHLVMNDQLMGLTAMYNAVHGVEDVLEVE